MDKRWDRLIRAEGPLRGWYETPQKALLRMGFFVEAQRFTQTDYHQQPGIEISIAITGRALVLSGNAPPMLHVPGTVVAVQVPHQIVSDPQAGFERIVVCLDVDRLEALGHPRAQFPLAWLPPRQIRLLHPAPAHASRLSAMAQELARESRYRGEEWTACSLALITQLLVLMTRLAAHAATERPPASRPASDLVERTIACILPRLSERLHLYDVARTIGVTPEHLTRSFRQSLGIPFQRYLLLERMEVAKRLLSEASDASVTDVALDVGFESLSDFARAFRRVVGVSPSAYRRSSRQLA